MSDINQRTPAEQAASFAEERANRLKRQRDQLLEAIEAHRAEKGKVPPANMVTADRRLYELADQTKSKEGGDARERDADQTGHAEATRIDRGGSDNCKACGRHVSESSRELKEGKQ